MVAQQVLLYVLDQFLKLLHPFMPFITEEIWQAIPHTGESIMIEQWPLYRSDFSFKAEEIAMESIMGAIRSVRNRRAEMNVPPSKKSTLYIVTTKKDVFSQGVAFISKLAYAEQVIVCDKEPDGFEDMVSCVTSDAAMFIPMSELIDFEKELERIDKEMAKAQKDLAMVEGKLNNQGFLAKAPEAVVANEQTKAEKARNLISQLEDAKKRLQK